MYFYGARWYDAALGRFISADTIIPNPSDPPSFDRYAYVRNSPIVYNDPTGHNLNCGVRGSHAAPEDCAEADPHGLGWIKHKPGCTMTEKGCQNWTMGLDDLGQKAYDMYQDWNNTSGWWNNNTPGSMTLETFIGILLMLEMQSEYAALDLYVEAFGRQIWMPLPNQAPYCSDSSCFAGVFNAIGHELGVAKVRFGGTQDPVWDIPYWAGMAGSGTSVLLQKAAEMGSRVLDSTLWSSYNTDAPYYFGNPMPTWNPAWAPYLNALPNQVVLGANALAWYKNGSWDPGDPDNSDMALFLSLNQADNFTYGQP